jgi:hypothetical protein
VITFAGFCVEFKLCIKLSCWVIFFGLNVPVLPQESVQERLQIMTISSMGKVDMNEKTEGALGIIAALIVLLSAMWDPRISIAISVLALIAFGAYKLIPRKG